MDFWTSTLSAASVASRGRVQALSDTPDSSASIPTSVSRQFDEVDAVLLIDNAKQPMQAAPVAVMRNLVSSGKSSKLLICFTAFDMVVGDNLRGFQSKEQHVLASAENALTGLGANSARLQNARFASG